MAVLEYAHVGMTHVHTPKQQVPFTAQTQEEDLSRSEDITLSKLWGMRSIVDLGRSKV